RTVGAGRSGGWASAIGSQALEVGFHLGTERVEPRGPRTERASRALPLSLRPPPPPEVQYADEREATDDCGEANEGGGPELVRADREELDRPSQDDDEERPHPQVRAETCPAPRVDPLGDLPGGGHEGLKTALPLVLGWGARNLPPEEGAEP